MPRAGDRRERSDQPVPDSFRRCASRARRRRFRRCCSGWRPFASRPPRRRGERCAYRRSPRSATMRRHVMRAMRDSLGAWQVRPSFAQGVATHTAKPVPRRALSGRPFNARLADVFARRGSGADRLWPRRHQEMHPRDDQVRRVLRLRQRRLDGRVHPQWHPARRRSAGRHQSALQEQPRRHLHRRHRTGRPRRRRVGVGRLRR